MAVHAIDLDGIARLSIELAVAMAVLFEMAINAVHALLEMNVFEMDSLVEFLRIVERHRLVFAIQQRALAVVLEHRAENPAMAVEVGKLCVVDCLLNSGVPVFSRKFTSDQSPRTADPSGLRASIRLRSSAFGWLLLRRPHVLPVHFVVPPRVAEIRRDHVRARMDVAHHALARRNGARELVTNRMSGLVVRNGRILRRALAEIAVLRE